jgi:hypothetical protein
MTLTDFITNHRKASKKPTADIRSRWISRIIARNLHTKGAAGATNYLRDYGKGISAAKVIAFAIQAEVEGCDDLARGFWAKAYELTTGLTPREDAVEKARLPDSARPNDQDADSEASVPQAPSTASAPTFPMFPSHLQPGAIITMQPVDALGTQDDYIRNPLYCGQPKRDGSRIVIIASSSAVAYQSRSTSIIATPSVSFDGAFRRAAEVRGPFVLDGEVVFLDRSGGEHRTGSQAAQANAINGYPEAPVCCRISIFKALFTNGRDLTGANEEARIAAAGPIAALAQSVLIRAGVVHHDIEQVPTAWTAVQKQALVQKQQAEGREGEVWIRWDTHYLGGKAPGEVMVRTKYLTETEVVITDLTPSTVAGRPFAAVAVSARYPDGDLRPVGRVGTGFSQDDARLITTLVAQHPEGLRILVRHQGRTETGMLWHARFLRIIGPVGMAA